MTTATIKSTRSEVFTTAWSLVKNAGKTLSEALKEAWSKFKKVMENVNFEKLSDEQLSKAAFEALKECFARGGELAINAVALIEKVKSEFDREEIREAQLKAERELKAERDAKLAEENKAKINAMWKREKALAEKLSTLLGYEDLYLTVWSKDGSGVIDKRIYLKTGDFFSGKEVATLFVSGNSKKVPMELDTTNNKNIGDIWEKKGELLEILSEYASGWENGKFNIATALKYQG